MNVGGLPASDTVVRLNRVAYPDVVCDQQFILPENDLQLTGPDEWCIIFPESALLRRGETLRL